MAKQYGTVLVFKSGLNPGEIRHRIKEALADIIDETYSIGETRRRNAQMVKYPFRLESFDLEKDGAGPVWYIP